MADRFPLIVNSTDQQIQELVSGDNIDLTGSSIVSATSIGIGLASPTQSLHVQSASTTSARVSAHGYICRDNYGTASSLGNGMMSPATNSLALATNSQERLRIDSSGNLILGTTTAATNAEVTVRAASPQLSLYATPGNTSRVTLGDTDDYDIGQIGYDNSDNSMFFATNASTRISIDSSGRLLQGKTSTKGSFGENVPTYCTEIVSSNPNIFEISNNGTGTNSYSALVLSRSDGGSVNSHTAVDSGDKIGEVFFIGADGSDRFNGAASINAVAAADFTSNNCPAHLIFRTNGGSASLSERMRIDSSGNVNFGSNQTVAFPSGSGLQVYHASAPRIKLINDTTGAASGAGSYLYMSGDDFLIENKESANMRFYTSATEKMRIDSSGNVGIGENNPATKLHLKLDTDKHIRFQGNIGEIGSVPGFQGVTDSGTLAGLGMRGNDLRFATGSAERMRISSAGNVGVGTDNPGAKLDVNGTAKFESFVYGQADSGILYLADNVALSPTKKLYFDMGSNTYIHEASGDNLAVVTGGTERLRVDSSGRFLVGPTSTSTPGTAVFQGNSTGSSSYGLIRLTKGSTSPSDGDTLGLIAFGDSNHATAAQISCQRDGGTWTSGSSHPTRLVFNTASNGSSGSSEKLRITSGGNIQITDPSSSTGLKHKISFVTESPHQDEVAHIGFDRTASAGGAPTDIIFATGVVGSVSERVRIDSDGNMGLGTDSPADGDGFGRCLDVRSASGGAIYMRHTSDTTNDTFIIGRDAANSYLISKSGNIIFNNNGAARMRIESDGSILAGGQSGSYDGGFVNLELRTDSSTLGGSMTLVNGESAQAGATCEIDCYQNFRAAGKIVFGRENGSNWQASAATCASYMAFFTNNAGSHLERARITASGTSYFRGDSNAVWAFSGASAGTSFRLFYGAHSAGTDYTGGTSVYTVWTNGNVVNANNSYGALSDAKLKENIVDASSQWNDIKDLRVRNYNFIEGQTHTQIGVVAQEVETVSPGLVYESPDTDEEGNDLGTTTKSVNYSVLYMKSVKALQEAMNRIETLEAKVAALEAG